MSYGVVSSWLTEMNKSYNVVFNFVQFDFSYS